ncbi:MAG: molybdenum cofactor guanylyltransferase [Chloroflexi bacterium]|nr:MAG: molybdenum cofactor guanylyltransferase [Chloroflexota bacterium]MBL1194796.1 molybdenum cofactor guanylyltransferase [Chloroflexota bacterium]NOH12088.1 molybdenum cofactor guanylyltransferase [Chloroflexota bacterium]
MELSIVLQAGGKSSRMGQDKGLLDFGGVSLAQFILEQVDGLGAETIIISNQPEAYQQFGLPVYPDVYPDIGALGGLYSAIYHAKFEYCLLLACDMPFVSRPLVEHLISLAPDYDAVIPRLEPKEFAEPFRAVYKKSCLKPIEGAIKSGQRRVISFFDEVDIRFVDQPEIESIDPQGRSFFNINTPEDLEHARSMLKS